MSDDDEFTTFAASRWPTLVRSAVMLGCSRPDAEDLVQTVLATVWQRWRRVHGADDPDAYVYRMLTHQLASIRRRRWWGERPTDPNTRVFEGAAPDDVAASDDRDLVVRALRSLPHDQRVVLVLRHVADLSEQQTAAVLGVAAGTVKSRASRGLAAIDPVLLTDAHSRRTP